MAELQEQSEGRKIPSVFYTPAKEIQFLAIKLEIEEIKFSTQRKYRGRYSNPLTGATFKKKSVPHSRYLIPVNLT